MIGDRDGRHGQQQVRAEEAVSPVAAITASSTSICRAKWTSVEADGRQRQHAEREVRTFFTSPALPTTESVAMVTDPAKAFQTSNPDSR